MSAPECHSRCREPNLLSQNHDLLKILAEQYVLSNQHIRRGRGPENGMAAKTLQNCSPGHLE